MLVRVRVQESWLAGAGAFLAYAGLIALAPGVWLLLSELAPAHPAGLAAGPLAHWQIWIALSIALLWLSRRCRQRIAGNAAGRV